jgi:alpha-1,2-mannosyltransferase
MKYLIGFIQAVFLLIVILWNYLLIQLMVKQVNMNDFGKFYYAAKAFFEKGDIYGPNPASLIPITETVSKFFMNVNPPHFLFAFLPFSFLTPKLALFSWYLVNTFCLIFSFFIIIRETGLRFNLQNKLWLIIGVLSSSAFGMVLVTGQISFVIFCLVTLAWSRLHRGQWNMAGLILGMAMSLKLQLLILLPYLLLRRKILSFFIGLFVFLFSFFMGLMVFGFQAHRNWLAVLQSIDWEWAGMNASFLGFLTRVFSKTPHFYPFFGAPHLIKPMYWIGSAVLAFITFGLIFKRKTKESIDLDFALLLLCALLISPLGWQYYFWLAIGPLTQILLNCFSAGKMGLLKETPVFWLKFFLALSLPGLFYPTQAIPIFLPNPYITLTIGSIYFWTDLFLWMACIYCWLYWDKIYSPARSSVQANG